MTKYGGATLCYAIQYGKKVYDLIMMRILGETPSFKGIKGNEHDSPIEMMRKEHVTQKEAAQCNANLVGNVSPLAEAVNSGWSSFEITDMFIIFFYK